MPQVALAIGPSGPLLDVLVGVSTPRALVLVANQGVAPGRAQARFLVDTGASHTVVDTAIVAALGLTPTSLALAQTPTTGGVPQQVPQYDVSLFLRMRASGRMFNALPVFALNLRPQGIDGLLGRDVLAECLLTYSGPDQAFLFWC